MTLISFRHKPNFPITNPRTGINDGRPLLPELLPLVAETLLSRRQVRLGWMGTVKGAALTSLGNSGGVQLTEPMNGVGSWRACLRRRTTTRGKGRGGVNCDGSKGEKKFNMSSWLRNLMRGSSLVLRLRFRCLINKQTVPWPLGHKIIIIWYDIKLMRW